MSGRGILDGLFASEVVSVEVDLARDPIDDLTPEEATDLPRAHPDRLLEYRAGRHCARLALSRLGVTGVSILRASDRSPIWPKGFVGSITHSRKAGEGWCAATVARSSAARGIGIDGEVDEPLETKLWDRVLTGSERSWLETLPESDRGTLAKVVFSAKESTYKCQYPITSEFLEFHDVEVRLLPAGASFEATLLRAAGGLAKGHTFAGRFVRKNGVIATAVLQP